MRWSVNLKCEPGSSTLGMWQVEQFFQPTGQGLAVRPSSASAFATAGDLMLAGDVWQALHLAAIRLRLSRLTYAYAEIHITIIFD